MATKDIVLRKRLIKEAVLLTLVLAALTGGGILLSGYDDDAGTEKQRVDGENSSVRAEQTSIQQMLGADSEVRALYNVYMKNHGSNFTLNRESASRQMATLREKHHLADLSLTISPIVDAQDTVQLKNSIAVKSDVTLSFGAVTDSSIYTFIGALQRFLPGTVLIKDLKFSRTGDLTGPIIKELTQHHITPLVSCDLSFAWLGMRPNGGDAKNPSAQGSGNAR